MKYAESGGVTTASVCEDTPDSSLYNSSRRPRSTGAGSGCGSHITALLCDKEQGHADGVGNPAICYLSGLGLHLIKIHCCMFLIARREQDTPRSCKP